MTATVKASFIKEAHMLRLQQNIASNARHYQDATPWLGEYFGSENWRLESHIEIPENIELQEPTSGNLAEHDLANTKILYSALKHLTPLQAADLRFWAYLTHVTHWKYMRARWPVERYTGESKVEAYIRTRYFFMSNKSRAPIRNGLARLWWCGYASYDALREDPFELTVALLKTDEVRQQLMERAFSHNSLLLRSILGLLAELEKKGKAFYERDPFRELAAYFVQVGGVTILDALESAEIVELMSSKISQILSRPSISANT